MTETRIEMAGVVGIAAKNGKIEFRFKDAQNNAYCLEIPEGAAGGMNVGLLSAAASLQASGFAQPMSLYSGRPFTLSDGRAGLELTLDHSLRLPVIFPKEAIPVLRTALDGLERLSKTASPPRAN